MQADAPQDRTPALQDAFFHILGQTTVPIYIQYSVCDHWVTDQINNRGKRSLEALKPLSGIAWDWADFDRARAMFQRYDIWPSPWHNYRKAGMNAADPMTTQRLKILNTSLRTAVASREYARGEKYARLGLYGWHIRYGSPASRMYAEPLSAGVNVLDWRTWPPFYAGDTSNIMANL